VTTAIPADTPAAGTIRVKLNTGVRRMIAYTSWTAPSTFNIAELNCTGANAATAPKDVMITYIDKEATGTSATFQSQFQTTRDLRFRVRDGGGTPIKTNEGNSQLTSAGGGASATRTSDA